MFRSDLCDYSDAFIVVKGRINVRATANTDIDQKDAAFKNNASFRSCITKINSTLIDNAEDLDIVMPMYNLLELLELELLALNFMFQLLLCLLMIISNV